MKITFEGSPQEVVASMGEFIVRISDSYAAGSEGALAAEPVMTATEVLSRQNGPGRPAGVKDSEPRKRGPNKAKITPLAVVAPAATQKQLDTNAAPAAATLAVSAPKLEDAQIALAALFEAKGMTDSLKVLTEFKVKKVQELKPELYSAFITAAQRAAAA